jgi:saccharopine dehydrogenase-like NADP-dependent oxidoreductase
MKQILLFGAGKSAISLIEYLIAAAPKQQWRLTIVDQNQDLAEAKAGKSPYVTPITLDIREAEPRRSLIQKADLVISLLPPALHENVANDCLELKKHLLTASYRDAAIRKLAPRIKAAGILFMYEMGLDPGIDHMSAVKLIRSIKSKGGQIRSFRSFCGGLPDPSTNDNPWHFKISWNPRNLVLAGKTGGTFKEKGKICSLDYEALFQQHKTIQVPGLGKLAYYPNRDSMEYIELYQLEEAHTFIRATLRFQDFCEGWDALVKLGLTDEKKCMDTDSLPYVSWATQNLGDKKGVSPAENLTEFLHVKENSKVIRQLRYLGFLNGGLINQGKRSNAEVLQQVLENKLKMEPEDRDLIVMQHEIEFERHEIETKLISTLQVTGKDRQHTAMAKTVGLPLGILAKLLLSGNIKITGLHIPITPEVYQPVLKELEQHDIRFEEHFT